jgi:hypothetical protein
MSCWVVPSVASEYLQKPVDQILLGVQAGEIPSQRLNGFLFVDVAPDSPVFAGSSAGAPPPTYVAVSAEELHALTQDDDEDCDVEESIPMGDWRTARETTSSMRLRPAA